GPSAGIAMATGIYSAIFKYPIKNTVAMTGENSIHGKVKPVGGVYAKVRAAKLAGAKTVIIPAENMDSMLKEIQGIEIIPVRELHEVFHIAFEKEEVSREKRSFSFPIQQKKSM